jgi:hypothetical protein
MHMPMTNIFSQSSVALRLQNIRHTEAKDDAPIRRSQSTVGPYDGDRYEGGCHEGYRGGRYLHANELIMIHDVVG